MADNVVLNQPTTSGATIATDDIGGVQHQLIKIEFGIDGAATPVSSADPLPITAASLPLPTGAATAANQQTDALTDTELRATPVPISGTVTATPTGTQNVDVTANTIGLSTGAKQDTGNTSLGSIDTKLSSQATAANQATEIASLASIDAGIPAALGQAAMAASMPVVIASNQSAVPVSGTVTVDTSLLATAAKQDSQTALLTTIDADTGNISTKIDTVAGAVSGTEMQVDVLTLPAITLAAAQTLATVTTLGTITNTVPTKEVRSSTPTQSSPSVTNASTSILASNANRLGATIYNEGTAICYMKLGSTASITSYTIQIAVGGYYELPFGYTGAVDGITSASTAQLRVTELTT